MKQYFSLIVENYIEFYEIETSSETPYLLERKFIYLVAMTQLWCPVPWIKNPNYGTYRLFNLGKLFHMFISFSSMVKMRANTIYLKELLYEINSCKSA